MRIAAIYIQENSLPYIFGEGHSELTSHLGGEFFYNAAQQLNGNVTIESKEENPQYINNFWSENISMISAFVGANGTGKSTILQQLKEGRFRLICEDKNGSSKIIRPGDLGIVIYYTPYFTESREDSEPQHTYNISKLAQLKRDSSIEARDINTHLEFHNSEVIKRLDGSREDNTIKAFKLEELYKTHEDEIRDMVKIKKLYSIQYLLKLKRMLRTVDQNISLEELYRLAFGTYINELDFHKRPLS